MVERRPSPGRWLYLLSLIIFVISVLAAIVLVVVSVRHFRNLPHGFTRVVAPGTTVVDLKKSGSYTIFYEYESEVNGQSFDTGEQLPNLLVSIKAVDTDEVIDVNQTGSTSNYSLGQNSGISVLKFKIDHAGSYAITTQYLNGATGPDVVLAIGQGFTENLVGGIASIFGSIAVFCGGTMIAIVLTLIVFFMRQRRPRDVSPPPAPSQVV
ncbi:MAG: hypothetical protein WBW04_18300 [Nitrolancea sp.]